MQPRARPQLSQKVPYLVAVSSSTGSVKRAPQRAAILLPLFGRAAAAAAGVVAARRSSSIAGASATLRNSFISSRSFRAAASTMSGSDLGQAINVKAADKVANGDAGIDASKSNANAADAAAPTMATPTSTTTPPTTPAARLTTTVRRKLPPPPSPDAPLLSVAPMMDWTDVHFRALARLISKKSWLYTEMVVDTTLLHNPDVGRFLEFPESQRPIVCQLGGSDPGKLAAAAAVAARFGYDEINLNCGCPSDRVAGAGCFGASLMKEPARVAEACRAMREAVRGVEARGEVRAAMREIGGWGGGSGGGEKGKEKEGHGDEKQLSYRPPKPIDVTVKCRLGVDDLDSFDALCEFVRVVSTIGQVTHFVVHARKCHLQGLSPAQNRSVPPLRHGWVFALKRDFPHLRFTINGGLESTAAARDVLLHDWESVGAAAREAGEVEVEVEAEARKAAAAANVGEEEEKKAPSTSSPSSFLLEGTMIGRAAYHSPWSVLGGADIELWGARENGAKSRREVLDLYATYCDSAWANADAAARRRGSGSETRRRPSSRTLAAPLLGLFHGEPGGKRWRYEIDQALKPPPGMRKQQQGKRKKHKRNDGGESGGGGGGGEGVEDEDELEVEERGPSMRDVIAHASKAIPAFILDAPPPAGNRIDGIARAAARAAEVAAEAATKHAARKKKGGPLPAPARPLMALPPKVAAAAAAAATVVKEGVEEKAAVSAAAVVAEEAAK